MHHRCVVFLYCCIGALVPPCGFITSTAVVNTRTACFHCVLMEQCGKEGEKETLCHVLDGIHRQNKPSCRSNGAFPCFRKKSGVTGQTEIHYQVCIQNGLVGFTGAYACRSALRSVFRVFSLYWLLLNFYINEEFNMNFYNTSTVWRT